jgi:hypothetical protein
VLIKKKKLNCVFWGGGGIKILAPDNPSPNKYNVQHTIGQAPAYTMGGKPITIGASFTFFFGILSLSRDFLPVKKKKKKVDLAFARFFFADDEQPGPANYKVPRADHAVYPSAPEYSLRDRTTEITFVLKESRECFFPFSLDRYVNL